MYYGKYCCWIHGSDNNFSKFISCCFFFIRIVKTCFPALDSSKTWENAYKMGIARHSNNAIENAGICLELNLTQNLKSANGKQNEQQQQQQQQY